MLSSETLWNFFKMRKFWSRCSKNSVFFYFTHHVGSASHFFLRTFNICIKFFKILNFHYKTLNFAIIIEHNCAQKYIRVVKSPSASRTAALSDLETQPWDFYANLFWVLYSFSFSSYSKLLGVSCKILK